MAPMRIILTCIKKAQWYLGAFLSSSVRLLLRPLLVSLILCVLSFSGIQTVFAQEAEFVPEEDGEMMVNPPVGEYIPNKYVLGEVISIVEEGKNNLGGLEESYQLVLVKIVSGEEAGEVETIEYRSSTIGFEQVRLEKGDPVVLVQTTDARGTAYYILDQFRLPVVIALALVFGGLAVVLGKWRGVMSLVGLGVSLIVLVAFIAPRIMAGDNPIVISALGAIAIATTSLFLAHGLKKRTLLAFSATMFVLLLAFGLAYATVFWAMLSGASTEEALFLQMGYLQSLDLRGLLLGGLVIGALGVLDDVTTAQVAAVEQIYRANHSLDVKELYVRGLVVGREHIAALVNTLALAYVGASFPLFLLFSLPDNPPLWVLLNGESLTEEMLRALIGGSALMLAVPVATALAAWAYGKGIIRVEEGHAHHH
ncbi:YibE/F family protein [bacterium]|nr:YibE/F family protein [bacterium]